MEGTSREKKLEDQKSCVFGPFRLYLLAFSFRRGLVGRKSWKSNYLVFLAYQLYQLACSFLWGGLGGRKKLGIQLPCVFGPFQLSILEFPREYSALKAALKVSSLSHIYIIIGKYREVLGYPTRLGGTRLPDPYLGGTRLPDPYLGGTRLPDPFGGTRLPDPYLGGTRLPDPYWGGTAASP